MDYSPNGSRPLASMFVPSGSNTVNPITAGVDAASITLPWLYGDAVVPVGDYCKVCWNVFKFAGFSAINNLGWSLTEVYAFSSHGCVCACVCLWYRFPTL